MKAPDNIGRQTRYAIVVEKAGKDKKQENDKVRIGNVGLGTAVGSAIGIRIAVGIRNVRRFLSRGQRRSQERENRVWALHEQIRTRLPRLTRQHEVWLAPMGQ